MMVSGMAGSIFFPLIVNSFLSIFGVDHLHEAVAGIAIERLAHARKQEDGEAGSGFPLPHAVAVDAQYVKTGIRPSFLG